MPKTKFTRSAAGAIGAAAMIVATATPAFAADKTVDIGYGHMTFIDDGDVFKICDDKADGKGVYGAVFYDSYLTTSGYERVMTISDGGDSGCDSKGYNIGNSGDYTFVICWGRYPTGPFENPLTGVDCNYAGEFNE
ncbi:hypothetical protein IF655_09190 [Streptomyces sp. DSM 110735]|uniref:hypothetical protein n=1 Tax=Streptomyces sp. DSM 110735 TaxID=2775031 RepID=UPI0018F52D95|nr:hypothetical protein [Streptomyces sp. DSM 110735]MBJ7903474.1 hypothetical protein [Streptomyces sp. DSM 110735]